MFKPLALSIGLRYTRAKRRNHFISFISLMSMLGIAVGVLALITTISVMSGFTGEFRDRLLSMVAHATISGAGGESLGDWPRAVEMARADGRIVGAAPYVEREALLRGAREQGAIVRGVLPEDEPSVSIVGEKMTQGSLSDLKPGAFNILLGKELALWLGVRVGDQVQIFVAEGTTTPMGSLPRAKLFTVAGTYEIGMQEYDRGMALVHMKDAQTLLRLGDGVTGVRLKLANIFDAWAVARDLADRMEGLYSVRDWSQDHANFFRAFKLEKTMMFILLSLVVGVAAFNLVSSLVMLVTDKQADIAILRTLGMSPGTIMRIFMVQGMLIGVVGIVLGVIGGVTLTLNLSRLVHLIESTFGIEVMPTDVYYISGVPTVLDPGDVGMIAAMAFVMCLLATLYPAWRAARTDPANALRYE